MLHFVPTGSVYNTVISCMFAVSFRVCIEAFERQDTVKGRLCRRELALKCLASRYPFAVSQNAWGDKCVLRG